MGGCGDEGLGRTKGFVLTIWMFRVLAVKDGAMRQCDCSVK